MKVELTEAQVHALHARDLIDHATWTNALRALRGECTNLTQHALRACECAIDVLVEAAINAACKSIQDRLGVTTGDLAATVLSGGVIEGELGRYVRAELEADPGRTRKQAEPRQCRACDCDGFLAADSSTPHSERLTRDSRVCTYCGGKGTIAS